MLRILRFWRGPFFKHASVPDVLELSQTSEAGQKDEMLLYFVDFSSAPGPGEEQISLSRSTDGIHWSETQRISIEGKESFGAAVDPSVVELEDGRLRMYFFGSDVAQSGDPFLHQGKHRIYSAVSSDGIHFRLEAGVRFSSEMITDPEVVRAGSQWLMFLSRGQQTLLARSADGLDFLLDEQVRFDEGGVPGAVELSNGKVRVFLSGHGTIWGVTFDPKTRFFSGSDSFEAISRGDGRLVADPACLPRRDGSYYLIFKYRPSL